METKTKYKIKLLKKSNKGKVSRDLSFITDGRMVTRHNDPNDTFRIWKEKNLKGETVDWKRGILIEHFKDQSAETIRDHVIRELKTLKAKMEKEMEISWEVENV